MIPNLILGVQGKLCGGSDAKPSYPPLSSIYSTFPLNTSQIQPPLHLPCLTSSETTTSPTYIAGPYLTTNSKRKKKCLYFVQGDLKLYLPYSGWSIHILEQRNGLLSYIHYNSIVKVMGQGARWEGVSGWGTHVNPWLILVNVWQNPLQYCKVISLQLMKINEKMQLLHLPPLFISLTLTSLSLLQKF